MHSMVITNTTRGGGGWRRGWHNNARRTDAASAPVRTARPVAEHWRGLAGWPAAERGAEPPAESPARQRGRLEGGAPSAISVAQPLVPPLFVVPRSGHPGNAFGLVRVVRLHPPTRSATLGPGPSMGGKRQGGRRGEGRRGDGEGRGRHSRTAPPASAETITGPAKSGTRPSMRGGDNSINQRPGPSPSSFSTTAVISHGAGGSGQLWRGRLALKNAERAGHIAPGL